MNQKCVPCGHYHAGTFPQVCTLLSCTCDQDSFVPIDNNFHDDQYHIKLLSKLTEIEQKITYMLHNIPSMRNKNDWQFWNSYLHYNLGFSTGTMYSTKWYLKIGNEATPDYISRVKRKICEEELATLKKYQYEIDEIKQEHVNLNIDLPMRYFELQITVKNFIKNSEFIPTEKDLLKHKGIKEDTIKEWIAA